MIWVSLPVQGTVVVGCWHRAKISPDDFRAPTMSIVLLKTFFIQVNLDMTDHCTTDFCIWRTICLVPVWCVSSICHMYTTDFAYDGLIFLVPLSLSYPSSPVLISDTTPTKFQSMVVIQHPWWCVSYCQFALNIFLSLSPNEDYVQHWQHIFQIMIWYSAVEFSVCVIKSQLTRKHYITLNPSNAEATFVQSTMTQRFMKTI